MTTNMIIDNEYGSVEYISFNAENPKQEDGLSIHHHLGEASLSFYGGQVLSWQPCGNQPIFWLSDKATFVEGKAIRGGIPICWPWFGPHPQDLTSCNHGIARTKYWELENVIVEKEAVTVTLTLKGDQEHPLYPHAFELKQELVFGTDFTQTLFINNLSDETVKYTGALHTYFAVSSPEKVTVNQLDAFLFEDKITGKHQQLDTLPHCKGPIDRVYFTHIPLSLNDHDWKRKILLETEYCQQWVLWNPGKEITQNMPDIHYRGEKDFVCLEAANTTWCEIPPQSEVYMRQMVKVCDMP